MRASMIERHPVLFFYLLAFAISWLGWLPMVFASHGVPWLQHPVFRMLLLLPAAGPTLAAVIVQRVLVGRTETGVWFRSLWRWRIKRKWIIVAIGLPAVTVLAARGLAQAFHLPGVRLSPDEDRMGLGMSAFLIALVSNLWEEVGWRGFALPRIQSQYFAWCATVIVGILWALWHVPLWVWKGNPMSQYSFAMWSISTVASAFVYTWSYNSTHGSVFIVALYHVLGNTYGVLLGRGADAASTVVNVAIVALIVALYGGKHLAREERVCAG